MSPAEAGALVNYFAAKDNVDFPYEHNPKTSQSLSSQEETRMENAFKIVTDATNYCVKCHKVGDYVPQGAPSAHSPALDRVAERLRPEFVEKWIANPARILPYTAMPALIKPDKPADQKLFPGTSDEQLQGLVDLLLDWSTFIQSREANSIKKMVKPPATPPAAAGAPDAAGKAS
jgi:hypothetical protein